MYIRATKMQRRERERARARIYQERSSEGRGCRPFSRESGEFIGSNEHARHAGCPKTLRLPRKRSGERFVRAVIDARGFYFVNERKIIEPSGDSGNSRGVNDRRPRDSLFFLSNDR